MGSLKEIEAKTQGFRRGLNLGFSMYYKGSEGQNKEKKKEKIQYPLFKVFSMIEFASYDHIQKTPLTEVNFNIFLRYLD